MITLTSSTSYYASIGQWIVDACIQDLSYRTSMVDLYSSYVKWCHRSRIAPLSKVALGRELSRRKFLVLRSSAGSIRWGLGLKDASEMPPLPVPDQPIFFGTTADLLTRLKAIEQLYGEMDVSKINHQDTSTQ